MNNQSLAAELVNKHCHTKCFSWSAVWVGAFVGVGLGFLLNLFSIAIGLAAFTATDAGITAFAIGGFIGFAIGGIVSMFVTGWTAGYLARPYCSSECYGVLYGFTAWCIALILAILLSVPVGKFISSSSNYLTNHSVAVIDYHDRTTVTTPEATTTVSTEKAKDVGKAAAALFVLFFLGALASSFGGYFGMVHRSRCCSTTSPGTCTKTGCH